MSENSTRSQDPDYSRYSTLRDWLAVCFRQRRLMLICFCGTMIGTAFFAWFWAARYYESSMQILVMPDRMDSAVSPSSATPIPGDQAVTGGQISSEMALLQGTDLLRQVAGACGLINRQGIVDVLLPQEPSARARAKLERATQSLAHALHVGVEKQADVIDVSLGAVGSREMPACVLRTLGKLYLEKRLQLRRPPALLAFFSEETDKYQKSLAETDEKLAAFGAGVGAVAPDVQRTLIAQKLVDTESAQREAQRSIAEDRQGLRSLLEQLGTTSPRVLTEEHDEAAGALLQQLEPQLLAARLRREQLAMKFAPDYPLLKEADKEVDDAKAAIENAERMQLHDQTTDRDPTFELLREDVAKTRADLAEREATVSALAQSIRHYQDQAVELDQVTIEFQSLQREAKANEENYLLYLSKREQERSAEALDNRRIANVVIAVAPEVPVLPAYSPIKVVSVGAGLALMLSIVAAFVGEYLDGSFRTPADVTDILGVPVLASMPRQAA